MLEYIRNNGVIQINDKQAQFNLRAELKFWKIRQTIFELIDIYESLPSTASEEAKVAHRKLGQFPVVELALSGKIKFHPFVDVIQKEFKRQANSTKSEWYGQRKRNRKTY